MKAQYFERAAVSRITIGEQTRAEALRRGAPFAGNAEHYAALAERWYGRKPMRGDDLRLAFELVFGTAVRG
jgi:hypothetical protein